MATKTGWGMLNYTRSRDVDLRNHRNYVECVRAGIASRAMERAGIRAKEQDTDKARLAHVRSINRFEKKHAGIPSRDSAMV